MNKVLRLAHEARELWGGSRVSTSAWGKPSYVSILFVYSFCLCRRKFLFVCFSFPTFLIKFQFFCVDLFLFSAVISLDLEGLTKK